MTIHSIGTASRDYSDIATWLAACPTDLSTDIWRGETYNDSEFLINTGIVFPSPTGTDGVSHYIELTAAAGQSFIDAAGALTNPLVYDQTQGVGLRTTSGYTKTLKPGSAYLRISRLQIRYDISGTSTYRGIYTGGHGLLSQLLLENYGGNGSLTLSADIIENSLFLISANYSTAQCARFNYPTGAGAYNLTVVRPTDLVALTASAISRNGNLSCTVENCAAIGAFGACFATSGSAFSGDYNASSDTTAPGAHSLHSLIDSSQFVGVTSTAQDWRVKAGADLIGAGTPDTTHTGGLDIIGQTRDATTPTIGAWEYVASGGGISGAADVTDDDDAVAGTGQVAIEGAAGITEADDTVAAAGTVETLVWGAYFDNATYAHRGAALTGIANGKVGTISFWVNTTTTSIDFLLDGVNPTIHYFHIHFDATGHIYIIGYNAATSQILQLSCASAINDGANHHILASWDLLAGVGAIYIDDVDDTDGATVNLTNDTIPYASATNWGIGCYNTSANLYAGDMAELWFDPTTFIDLTGEANRRKFIDASGGIVDLGADGSNPTGSSPILYLRNNWGTFGTNEGTGGDFTVTGTLTQPAADFGTRSASPSGVSGAASVTEDDDTVAGAGQVAIDGAAGVTEDDDTVAGAGQVAIDGAASVTEDDDTVAGAGQVAIDGAAGVTEDDDTVAGAGQVGTNIHGAADLTEDDDTVAGAGQVAIDGAAGVTEDDDTVAGAGTIGGGIAGAADLTEDDDTVAGAGQVAIEGAADVTEDDDTAGELAASAYIVDVAPYAYIIKVERWIPRATVERVA